MEFEASESVVFHLGDLDSISVPEIETHENTFENVVMRSSADSDSGERIKIPENVDTYLNYSEPGRSGTILGGIEVPETATFHLKSRWVKQSPGGFLEGVVALPPTCTRLTISCKEPCFLHLPFYTGGTRDVCSVNGSRVFADMEEGGNGRPAKGIVHSLQVQGEKLMYGSKEVAEVVTENNRHVVHLGGKSGKLRIAVIKPCTKQVDPSEKKNLVEEVKTTRIVAVFYNNSVILETAESKTITAKKRKVKDLASGDLDETVGTGNTAPKKKRKTKELTSSVSAGLPSQFPTFPNPGEQWHYAPSAPPMPDLFQECAAKEKEVGSADSSSSSNFIVDELVNNPPYCEQGYSNPDGEVGEVARFADNPDDLEAIWNWNWNNFDSAL